MGAPLLLLNVVSQFLQQTEIKRFKNYEKSNTINNAAKYLNTKKKSHNYSHKFQALYGPKMETMTIIVDQEEHA